MERRPLDVVVMSDLHLGTYGCHAREIVNYLKSIQPQILVLNGDVIDGWQFSKRYFPVAHMQVIKEIMSLLSKGTRVIYITGNHDEMLRRYSDIEIGNFQLTDKVVMEINGKMTWIFHGDVFDATTKGGAKILAKLGGHGYDLLIVLNRCINWFLKLAGREKMSFSKRVKNSVKKAVSWIGDFEQTAAELAIRKQYDYVICGHIHQPQNRVIETKDGSVTYLNSGDWVENLTSLEYTHNEWKIYQYNEKEYAAANVVEMERKLPELNVVTDKVAMSYPLPLPLNGSIEDVSFIFEKLLKFPLGRI
jgi:UDP-2,3-diacylglucosamine pyrophosphatase LpxH